MPGRMGNETCTVQNLKVIKIDTVPGLIYVKGGVPGVDNALVRVKDAVKKGWFNKIFPKDAQIPFPTSMGTISTERELLPKLDLSGTDPFARTRREKT